MTSHMTPDRKTAFLTGVFFILTFITSIGAMILYQPVLHDSGFINGSGSDTAVLVGAFLELGLVVTNVGTAVILYPVLKRHRERWALGYVATRIVESMLIAVGIIALLAVVTLRHDVAGAGSDAATLKVTGQSLVAVHDMTFLLGPGFCVAVGNGFLLAWMMFRSGLVPRRMAWLGVIGGPMIMLNATGSLFGLWDLQGGIGALLTIPEFFWELSLGLYLAFKGFRQTGYARLARRDTVAITSTPALAAAS